MESNLLSRVNAISLRAGELRRHHYPGAPSVIIIGASKKQDEAVLREAWRSGLVHFGENKVQEALAKWPSLKLTATSVLHLIGPLQSNKAEIAAGFFDVIQTLDRPKLAEALAKAMDKTGKRPEIFIQVNTGREPQKAGVLPEEAEELISLSRALGLPLIGLMCVPPANENPAPHFQYLKKLADDKGLPNLSMGMSDDYETAIECGATHIRIGTALFGKRG